MRSSTATLASALRILAGDIQSPDNIPALCLLEAADRLEELQTALSETIKQRDQAREHYDRIQRKCHPTEMELKKAFGKIEVLSIDNDSLKSDRDNAWSKAVDLKKEVKESLEFIKALEKENGELMEQVGSLMFITEIMQKEINKLQKKYVIKSYCLDDSPECNATCVDIGNNKTEGPTVTFELSDVDYRKISLRIHCQFYFAEKNIFGFGHGDWSYFKKSKSVKKRTKTVVKKTSKRSASPKRIVKNVKKQTKRSRPVKNE